MEGRVAEIYGILEMTLALRGELMTWLKDDDLAFRVTMNPTLGQLCREIGEVQLAYTESLKTLKLDLSYRAENGAELEASVEKLTAWYTDLNAAMKSAIETLSEDDLGNKLVDRTFFELSLGAQIHTFREALLIFYAKVDVYLRAMDKEPSDNWQGWIG